LNTTASGLAQKRFKAQGAAGSRVGVYRILGKFEGKRAIIEVVRVGHQGVYKNMPRI